MSVARAQTMPQTVHGSASLYVGDLSPDVPEGKLYDMFIKWGPVASIKVPRDVNTRRSLGYAYVNYSQIVHAESAIANMNGFDSGAGKKIRVCWSQRDPNLRKSGKGNLFIKNLAKEIDLEQLRDTFAPYGNILSCKVATDSKGESLGYGFVHFASVDESNHAREEVNGKQLGSFPQLLTVSPFIPKQQRDAILYEPRQIPQRDATGNPTGKFDNVMLPKFTNVYVKNLPTDMSKADFELLFAKCGDITSSYLADIKDATRTNFGFINFGTTDQARLALDTMNGVALNDKKLFVAQAERKEERQRKLRQRFEQIKLERQQKYAGANLYVKNLSDSFDNEKLISLFLPFGAIISAKIMVDKTTQKSKCFGFVQFSSSEEAIRAMNLQSTMIEGKPLYVAMAQNKIERQMHIEQNMIRRNLTPQIPHGYGPSPGYVPSGYGGHMRMYANQMPNQWAGGSPAMAPVGYHGQRVHLVPAGGQPGRGYQNGPQGGGRGRGSSRGGRGQIPGGGINIPSRQGNQIRRGAPQVAQQSSQPEEQHLLHPEEMSVSDFVKAAASMPDVKRKHVFGERLFPMVAAAQPDLAPKITGMLLEMEDTEIVELLESSHALEIKIQEAMSVLESATESADGGA